MNLWHARAVPGIHETFAFVTLGANVVAAVWGVFVWSRGIPSRAFWWVLRVAQGCVIVQVIIGLALLAEGHRPADNLHYLYAVIPLIVAVVTEAMRIGASQRELEDVDDPENLPRRERILLARRIVLREIGIMTVGLALVVTMLIRAIQSG
jgi:hypothetical protein